MSIARRMLIAIPYALGQAAPPYSDSCLSLIAKLLTTLLNDCRSDEGCPRLTHLSRMRPENLNPATFKGLISHLDDYYWYSVHAATP